jgi:hypothetical protein
MIQIQNNYLNSDLLYEIEKTVSDKNFHWYVDSWQTLNLEHFLVREKGADVSLYMNKLIGKILLQLKAEYVLESTVTLYTKKPELIEYDAVSPFLINKNYKTFLLFLNTCDGYTNIHASEKIQTKQNMAIFLDKPFPFSNTNTTNGNCRGVLAIHYT